MVGIALGILGILAYHNYQQSDQTNVLLLWYAFTLTAVGGVVSLLGLFKSSAFPKGVATTVAVVGAVLNAASAGIIWKDH